MIQVKILLNTELPQNKQRENNAKHHLLAGIVQADHECCLSNSQSFPIYAVHCICSYTVLCTRAFLCMSHFHIHITGLLPLCHQTKQAKVKPDTDPVFSLLNISCAMAFSQLPTNYKIQH